MPAMPAKPGPGQPADPDGVSGPEHDGHDKPALPPQQQLHSKSPNRRLRRWLERQVAGTGAGSDGQPLQGWLCGFIKDRLLPNFQRFVTAREPLLWLLALLTGLVAAYAAIVFLWLIGLFQWPWLGTRSEFVFAAARETHWSLILLAPVAGGLIVGLILQHVMPGRRTYSVADVIEAQALLNCQMPAKAGLLSALVTALSLGAGASAGREGPVVHLGATLAMLIERFFKLPSHGRRTLLGAGVAAAVAASFNAPFAGILFAHEVILGHYALSALVPVVIASVSATAVARHHLGDAPAFHLAEYVGGLDIVSYWEFPAFVLLGLTCALVAIVFQFVLVGSDRLARSFTLPLWLRPVLGGVIIGLMGIFLPQILGVGYDATDAALKQQFPLWLLVTLVVAKMVATAVTLASRFGGGVFSPSLYLGTMTGGAFGMIAGMVFPDYASPPVLYAVLGMGAVAAAVLGAPLSTALIVFELTGDYGVTIALLLVIAIATGVSLSVHGVSFFHWQLNMRGIFLQSGPHARIMRLLKVRDFMRPVEAGEETRRSAAHPDSQADADAFWLAPDDDVRTALRAFDKSGRSHLPVVHPQDPNTIIGWARHVDALAHFNEKLIEAHVEEHR